MCKLQTGLLVLAVLNASCPNPLWEHSNSVHIIGRVGHVLSMSSKACVPVVSAQGIYPP